MATYLINFLSQPSLEWHRGKHYTVYDRPKIQPLIYVTRKERQQGFALRVPDDLPPPESEDYSLALPLRLGNEVLEEHGDPGSPVRNHGLLAPLRLCSGVYLSSAPCKMPHAAKLLLCTSISRGFFTPC